MPIGVTSLALLAGYLKSQVPPPTDYQAPVGPDNYLGIGTMKIKKGGEKKWMQDAADSIEKRGTGGSFRKWCKDHGYSDGCDSACISAAQNKGGSIAKKANLAKAYCKECGGAVGPHGIL